MKAVKVWAAFLLLIAILTACASGGAGQRTAGLLTQDYLEMSDAELQAYYQQLSDQLARESRAVRSSQRVGYGTGTFGAGAARGMADEEDVQALRVRWNEVRQELRRRELLP
ncbi:hypothetical protein [Geoalkalibacter halelectricus]|uniref:Lipoprotein n=1 Tax=Geoalkalibacter halelectricus TaxID=2847045 RepID=A0ABY5ZU01_9BACT|nr:hypothetical protein [Geoalkalibacter halelectricus]MDO3376915.1 hypothetical protein [Geoalkalibacter halelectricus]UWZ81139.1 hypothetical protein L9S41_07015 [Geoalkalibacter halelectricus]